MIGSASFFSRQTFDAFFSFFLSFVSFCKIADRISSNSPEGIVVRGYCSVSELDLLYDTSDARSEEKDVEGGAAQR